MTVRDVRFRIIVVKKIKCWLSVFPQNGSKTLISCSEMKSRCYFDVLDDFLSRDDLEKRCEHCCSSVSISCCRCLAGSLFSFVFSGIFLLCLWRALHASTLPSGLSRVNASLQARSNTMQLCTFCVARVLSDTLVLIIIISNVLFLCEYFFLLFWHRVRNFCRV